MLIPITVLIVAAGIEQVPYLAETRDPNSTAPEMYYYTEYDNCITVMIFSITL